MDFYHVSMADFGSGHVFCDVPKWNMELSKWDRGSIPYYIFLVFI